MIKHTVITIDIAHTYQFEDLLELLANIDRTLEQYDLELEDWKVGVTHEERLM